MFFTRRLTCSVHVSCVNAVFVNHSECATENARRLQRENENLVPGLFLELGDSFIVPSDPLQRKPCTRGELAAALAGAVAMPRLP